MRARFLRAALLCALARAAYAVEVVPAARVDILGGQFFFQGAHTSFSGNSDWSFAPGLKLSERDMLVPVASGQYRRTREVRELVGGGFLTQQTLDNTAALRWIRLLTREWNLKSTLSYKNELVTEADGERLGSGLFDYHKLSAGVEAEKAGDGLLRSVRHALGAYAIRFYHYRALASSTEELGSEVNAGDRVLDFDAYEYSIAADLAPDDATAVSLSALASIRPYRDQKIVTESGTYRDRDRLDAYLTVAASGRRTLPEWRGLESSAGLNLSYARLASNQDNYDAQNTRHNPGYYDYGELTAGPFVAVRLRKALVVALGYEYARRAFDHRPAQTASGGYGDRAIRMNTHTATLNASYPLGKGLSLKASGAYRRATSNMLYESSYRYNYWTAHYFVGLGWTL